MNQKVLSGYGVQQITVEKKLAQRRTIIAMLRTNNCSCADFLKKGIAQYNARIYELRRKGYIIDYKSITKDFHFIGFNENKAL